MIFWRILSLGSGAVRNNLPTGWEEAPLQTPAVLIFEFGLRFKFKDSDLRPSDAIKSG